MTRSTLFPKSNFALSLMFIRFYLIDGLGASRQWFADFQNYGTEHPNNPYPSVLEQFEGKEELLLTEQFKVLSHVPNLHSWASESKSGTKKLEYFSSNGHSPRDIILRILDDIHSDTEEKVLSITPIYSLVLSKQYHVPKMLIRKQNVSVHFIFSELLVVISRCTSAKQVTGMCEPRVTFFIPQKSHKGVQIHKLVSERVPKSRETKISLSQSHNFQKF